MTVLALNCCKAQFRNEEGLITPIKYDKPEWSKPIRYYFPSRVDTVLYTLCMKNSGNCFISIEQLASDTVEIFVYDGYNLKVVNQDTGSVERLIASTNRFWAFEKVTAPILFSTDFTYTFNNTVISHSIGGIKYIGRYPEKGTIVDAWRSR